jgi:hypothetical protein
MKQQLYLHIPEPCHEDWNKMNPVQQGRFCQSCSKQVVDFSLMTDHEVLNYFKNASGKTCGRFNTDQLERAIEDTKIEKKKGWKYFMASVVSFIVFNRINAQTNCTPIQGKVAVKPKPQKTQIDTTKYKLKMDSTFKAREAQIKAYAVMGDIVLATQDSQKKEPAITIKEALQGRINSVITGKVVDEKGTPLQYVIVKEKDKTNMVTSDSLGNYSIKLKDESAAILVFSNLGYETKEVAVTVNNKEEASNVILTINENKLPEIVVSGTECTKSLTGRMGGVVFVAGGVSSVRRVSKVDTAVTFFNKAIGNQAFKIYPNPVQKNSAVNISIKEEGEYSVQLLDNQSRLIKVQEVVVTAKQQTINLQLPSSIASGFYYVRIINEKTKKQSIDKIIVQ